MRLAIACVFTIAGLTAGLTAGQTGPKNAAQSSPPPGSAPRGKRIYVSYGCYQCHNYAANGGTAGARLAPNPLAFEKFARYVRKPDGEMPPYTRKVASDADLADIYAFLLTIPPPPPADGIAILKKR
jgi:mono/diheme cytochrome c family protein